MEWINFNAYKLWYRDNVEFVAIKIESGKGAKMLGKILVGMLNLSDIFSKSRNEILEEHRHRQRHVLVSFAMVMSCIAVGVTVTWSAESMSGLAAEILRPVALIAERVYLALGGAALVWCCASTVRLWRYESDLA